MKTRFLEMLAERRWIDGLSVTFGVFLVWAYAAGWFA